MYFLFINNWKDLHMYTFFIFIEWLSDKDSLYVITTKKYPMNRQENRLLCVYVFINVSCGKIHTYSD